MQRIFERSAPTTAQAGTQALRHCVGAASLLAVCFAVAGTFSVAADSSSKAAKQTNQNSSLAFPGAQGWAARTPGGRGGKILRVTTLASSGPGSFLEAIQTPGPRIVVFEVGGVIDLERNQVPIKEPFLTIAGQTAPSPGITLIRGGLNIGGHDVIVQHIRIRPGGTGLGRMAGVDFDAISTQAAHDVIVDHCSFSWATDENLSASGPRFVGKTPDEWRSNTSHRITFSNNIMAEGLAHSTHIKGEHSKGSLIHDNITDILIIGNLYSSNMERSPLFKGGVRGAVVNNLIYNPGQKAVHYNLIAEEWGDHPYQVGHLTLIGNVLRAGPSTRSDLALFALGGSGNVELYMSDNIAVDRLGNPLPTISRYTTAPVEIIEVSKPMLPEGVTPLPAKEVQDSVILNAGARPWDRDANDWRIVADTIEARGGIIDSEQEVGGYPVMSETRQKFDLADWDLQTMQPRKPPKRNFAK